MTTTNEALSRVGEFVRQWNYRARQGRSNEIYGAHFDPDAEPAKLYCNDLALIVGALSEEVDGVGEEQTLMQVLDQMYALIAEAEKIAGIGSITKRPDVSESTYDAVEYLSRTLTDARRNALLDEHDKALKKARDE